MQLESWNSLWTKCFINNTDIPYSMPLNYRVWRNFYPYAPWARMKSKVLLVKLTKNQETVHICFSLKAEKPVNMSAAERSSWMRAHRGLGDGFLDVHVNSPGPITAQSDICLDITLIKPISC